MAQLAISYSNGRPNFRIGLRKDEHMRVFEADPSLGTSRRVIVSRKGNRLYMSAAKTTLVDINKSYSSTYTPARNPSSQCITCCGYPERLDMFCEDSIKSRDVPTGFSGRDLYIDLPKDFITKSWPDSEIVELNAKITKRWVKQNNIAAKYPSTRQQSFEQPEEPDPSEDAVADSLSAADLIDRAAMQAVSDKQLGFEQLRSCIKAANRLCKELNCELTDDNGKTLLPTGFNELALTTHKVV